MPTIHPPGVPAVSLHMENGAHPSAESVVDGFVCLESSASPLPLESRPPESLTPGQREILGQQFRARALSRVFNDCERTIETDHRDALHRLRSLAGGAGSADALLARVVSVLQAGRLTINFKADQLGGADDWIRRGEYVNCFALGDRPGQPAGYSVGRARMEERVLGFDSVLDSNPFRDYGRYADSRDATKRQRWFQWTSRPLYAALDYLNGPRGGAPHFGASYLVLADHMKQVSTFTPVDSYATSGLCDAIRPDKVCTWHHFPRLVAHAQNDLFGYNCLEHLCRAADGKTGSVHARYGKGGVGNHIEAQVHGRVRLDRDVKEVHISRMELDQLHFAKQRDDVIQAIKDKNAALGRPFFFLD